VSSARESLALADDEEERPLAEEEPDKAAPVTANGPVSADDTSMLTSQDPLLGDAPKPEEQEPVGGEQDLVEEELVELVEEEEEEEGQEQEEKEEKEEQPRHDVEGEEMPDPRSFGRGFQMPLMSAVVLEDTSNKSFQMMTEGNPEVILDFCTSYWNGTEIRRLDEDERKKVLTFYNNAKKHDIQCVALAYAPLDLRSDSPLLSGDATTAAKPMWVTLPPLEHDDDQDVVAAYEQDPQYAAYASLHVDSGHLLRGQIFMGMVFMQNDTKEDMPEFIEDLSVAGIHFSYFSPRHNRAAKGFAERLGIATDWNCCISLMSQEQAVDFVDPRDKAQMPWGIESIRPHLQEVDDIPLHAPIFANALQHNIAEMIKIYQENGEVVCCLGNSADGHNSCVFAAADIAMSFEMLHPKLFVRPTAAAAAAPDAVTDADQPPVPDQPTPEGRSASAANASGNISLKVGQKHYTTNAKRLMEEHGLNESPYKIPLNEDRQMLRRVSHNPAANVPSTESVALKAIRPSTPLAEQASTAPPPATGAAAAPTVTANAQQYQQQGYTPSTTTSAAYVNARFNALGCAFNISRDTSPYAIMEVIREARRLNKNVQQAMTFILAAHLSLGMLVLLDQVCQFFLTITLFFFFSNSKKKKKKGTPPTACPQWLPNILGPLGASTDHCLELSVHTLRARPDEADAL